MLVRARTALLDERSAGMSFLQVPVSSRRGSSHALVPWNSDHACSASGPTGGHAFSGEQKRRTENAEQNAGHASDMRSRTLLIPGSPSRHLLAHRPPPSRSDASLLRLPALPPHPSPAPVTHVAIITQPEAYGRRPAGRVGSSPAWSLLAAGAARAAWGGYNFMLR